MNNYKPLDELSKLNKEKLKKTKKINSFEIKDYFEDDGEICFDATIDSSDGVVNCSFWWIMPEELGHFQYCTRHPDAETFVLDYLKKYLKD